MNKFDIKSLIDKYHNHCYKKLDDLTEEEILFILDYCHNNQEEFVALLKTSKVWQERILQYVDEKLINHFRSLHYQKSGFEYTRNYNNKKKAFNELKSSLSNEQFALLETCKLVNAY